MSAGVGIHGLWGLESQPISVGVPRAAARSPYRFEEKSSRDYDILSSESSSDDDFDAGLEEFAEDDVFGSQSSLEAAGIGRRVRESDVDDRHSTPIAIRPKTEESSQDLRRKSRRCAAEQSRDDAWERRRQMEELKSTATEYSRIVRSNSDCGHQQSIQQNEGDGELLPRSRSLTEEDFEELRGCIDLGFRFNVDAEKEDLALCNTLPALEVCYAANRQLQDLQSPSAGSNDSCSSWQIASPGEELQQVKEKLKHWARAVACISRQSC